MKGATTGYENFYDAPYFLMYAAAAAPPISSEVRGQDLVDGMKRLIDMDGPQYRIGLNKIPSTLQALTNGSIRLDGTMGPPEFNPTTGSRTTAGSVWCAGIDYHGAARPTCFATTTASSSSASSLDNGDPLEELPCAAKF